jgi:nitroreductase
MTNHPRLHLDADTLLSTTRSVRKRLDFDRPVPRSVVEECLQLALQAPSGSNNQGWHWIVVEDPAKKLALRDIYRENFALYAAAPRPQRASDDVRAQRMNKVVDSALFLAENFHRAPLLVIPAIEGRLDNLPSFATASMWGSLLPATWSFMLALRDRGLARRPNCSASRMSRSPRVDSSPSRTRRAPTSSPPPACRSTACCTGIAGSSRDIISVGDGADGAQRQ